MLHAATKHVRRMQLRLTAKIVLRIIREPRQTLTVTPANCGSTSLRRRTLATPQLTKNISSNRTNWQDHQKLQQQQEKEHQQAAKQNYNQAQKQQMEQRHTQQTQQLEQQHDNQQRQMEQRQAPHQSAPKSESGAHAQMPH